MSMLNATTVKPSRFNWLRRNAAEDASSRSAGLRAGYLKRGLRSLLMIPVFPLAGYLLMDQTGLSQWIVQVGLLPARMVGEGFGHVGLCFSVHYVINAVRFLRKAWF
jgi:hypothetical protein